MQISIILGLLVVSVYLNLAIYLILTLVAVIYCIGFAKWSEEKELEQRFGKTWSNYSAKVKTWRPSLLPNLDTPAVLYIDLNCKQCSEIADWFTKTHLSTHVSAFTGVEKRRNFSQIRAKFSIMPDTMNGIQTKLNEKSELSEREVRTMANILLDPDIDHDHKADLLRTGLESLELEGPTIDVCGTGGDKLDLFNVSTTSMFVIAAGGAKVIKHGNRGITSKSGGADVLEELGIKLDASPAQLNQCINEAGVGFLFAPVYHPTFKEIAPVRAKLAQEGVRTIFNLIGPLLNPAKPECQLVGICEPGLRTSYAEILTRLGRDSAWVVHGHTLDGRSVDEVSLMGSTHISKCGAFQDLEDEEISPEDFGLAIAEVAELRGGDATINAKILLDILSGNDRGAKRNMVVLNAAAGLTCAGLADHMDDAIEQARELIDSGAALRRLEKMQKVFK